ncbi:MAG: protease modulator HflC [Kiritimatiellaeota bacterium]|nr:protease modulator HflC [Kiritimatiellota bacterium]
MSDEKHTHEHGDGDSAPLHWPTILLGLLVAAIFLTAIFSFQLKSAQYAVVSTFGKVESVTEPGLHFRIPYPIQKIFYFDNRQRCFEGTVGRMEETYTADKQNIIVGVYVKYKIADPERLFNSERTIEEAEKKLNSLLRSDKDQIIGKYAFSQFINTNKDEMKLRLIEEDIKNLLVKPAMDLYGLQVMDVGIRSLGIPQKVTKDVINRMKSERQAAAEIFLGEGKKIAKNIKTEANRKKRNIISIATAKAKTIRAVGDAEAAAYYAVFKKKPELAVFLKKLDSLKSIVKSRTVLVLDTDTAPFDLLKPNSENLDTKK